MYNAFVRAKNKREAKKEMPWAVIIVAHEKNWWVGFECKELYQKYLDERAAIK